MKWLPIKARLNWLFSERSSSATFNTAQPSGITVRSAPKARCMEKIQERALKCVYSNHTASYESLLNKARLPSLELWEKWTSQFILLKLLMIYYWHTSWSWLKTLSHSRFKKFWKYPENSSHEEGAFWLKNSGTLCQRHLKLPETWKFSEMACELIFLFNWVYNRGRSLDKIMWYILFNYP